MDRKLKTALTLAGVLGMVALYAKYDDTEATKKKKAKLESKRIAQEAKNRKRQISTERNKTLIELITKASPILLPLGKVAAEKVKEILEERKANLKTDTEVVTY